MDDPVPDPLADEPLRIPLDSPFYPASLRLRLGEEAPRSLQARGACRLLRAPLTALLCSTGAPASLAPAARALSRELASAGAPVISGFQSPLERTALTLLLSAGAPVVVVVARALGSLRVPAEWRGSLAAGRMLLLSAAPPNRRRPDARLAEARNRVVAALAGRLIVLYATPAGRLHRLVREVSARGEPLYCLPHPANRDLVLRGAREIGMGDRGWEIG